MRTIVAYRCVWSSLKIWTMLRSDAKSSSLKTYRPAGKTLPPGISTRWLNVTIVFLFHSSAITLGRPTKTTRDEQKIIATTVSRFILTTPKDLDDRVGSCDND